MFKYLMFALSAVALYLAYQTAQTAIYHSDEVAAAKHIEQLRRTYNTF